MIELKERSLPNINHGQQILLFFTSPLCGTCQLAERMLLIAMEALKTPPELYHCRVNEWTHFVMNEKISSVPCLMILHHHEVQNVIYSFESVTKLHRLLKSI
ncbi:thioredoxin family protein [Terrilactibacillus laevilacticus]|uniref:Thioredoxin family protein n=1 Tax=Terrilactibacillus laevilacticus TaxID=1380157 RepID=A0ABW5PSL5_9BACI|nr:thioredoxin family protein [Terrilactibacillus laevilacticus]